MKYPKKWFWKEKFLNIHYFSFTIFFYFQEIIFDNFNIYGNNIISVKLAKVLLGYVVLLTHPKLSTP
jgi:hypothetical protein